MNNTPIRIPVARAPPPAMIVRTMIAMPIATMIADMALVAFR
jgi:hypothetical protein